MGGNGSAEYTEEQKKIAEQYTVKSKIKDLVLGEIKYMQHKKSDETVGWVDLTGQNMNIDEEFKSNFEIHSKLVHKNLATLKQMMHRKEEFMCGSQNKIEILFEYYDHNLLKDIKTRQIDDQHYSEADLWNIIDSVVSACSYLQENDISHQDITPESIMLTANGTVKVGNYNLITRGMSGYFKLFSQKTQSCYLSPQLVQCLKKAERNPTIDFHKSDVYSLGMVILQAATLKDISNCYKLSSGEIDYNEIEQRLDELKTKYGDILYNFVKELLNDNFELRPDWNALKIRSISKEVDEQLLELNDPQQLQYETFQHQAQNYEQEVQGGFRGQVTNVQQEVNTSYQQQQQVQQVQQNVDYLNYQGPQSIVLQPVQQQYYQNPYQQQYQNPNIYKDYVYQPYSYNTQINPQSINPDQIQYTVPQHNEQQEQLQENQEQIQNAELQQQQYQPQQYSYSVQPQFQQQPYQPYMTQQKSESVTLPQQQGYEQTHEANELMNQYQQDYGIQEQNQDDNLVTFKPEVNPNLGEQEGQQFYMPNNQTDSEVITEQYNDDSVYTGQKLNGLRHGKGKFQYTDGGVYEGDWNQGAMDGLGYLYYPNGKLAYEGEWQNNAFFGQGCVYNEDPIPLNHSFDFTNFDYLSEHWEKYQGEFQDDFKEGFGTLYLVNGEKYVGQFNHDMIHGQGAFYKNNGEVIQGTWQRNQLVSQ